MRYDLAGGLPGGFVCAASKAHPERPAFRLEGGALVNAKEKGPDGKEEYQYISAVAGEPVRLPVTLRVETSFDAYGAPLIVLAESLAALPDGRLEYGTHYEAVLFEDGINIWKIDPDDSPRGIAVKKIGQAREPVPAGERRTLTVRVTREGIVASTQGMEAVAVCPLPERMYVGLTACEGVNRFYAFEVEP